MSRQWTGEALIDELAARLWDTSATNKTRVRKWINEISNDMVSDKPLGVMKFKAKLLCPTEKGAFSLRLQKPTAVTATIANGGSLTDGNSYKAYSTFIIWDEDERKYTESELSKASAIATADATNKTIDIAGLDLYGGDSSILPATIWRRIYISIDSGSGYGEPFYHSDIENNTATTLSITTEPETTESNGAITPPSDSLVDQVASDNPRFESIGRFLDRRDMDDLDRYNPKGSTGTPQNYDLIGPDEIYIYPKLSSTATSAQRTLSYWIYRLPNEVFYNKTIIDLPLSAKKALIEGVIWKGYEHRDRDGKESKEANYLKFKEEWQNKVSRQKNRPSTVRDVEGDTFGFQVN